MGPQVRDADRETPHKLVLSVANEKRVKSFQNSDIRSWKIVGTHSSSVPHIFLLVERLDFFYIYHFSQHEEGRPLTNVLPSVAPGVLQRPPRPWRRSNISCPLPFFFFCGSLKEGTTLISGGGGEAGVVFVIALWARFRALGSPLPPLSLLSRRLAASLFPLLFLLLGTVPPPRSPTTGGGQGGTAKNLFGLGPVLCGSGCLCFGPPGATATSARGRRRSLGLRAAPRPAPLRSPAACPRRGAVPVAGLGPGLWSRRARRRRPWYGFFQRTRAVEAGEGRGWADGRRAGRGTRRPVGPRGGAPPTHWKRTVPVRHPPSPRPLLLLRRRRAAAAPRDRGTPGIPPAGRPGPVDLRSPRGRRKGREEGGPDAEDVPVGRPEDGPEGGDSRVAPWGSEGRAGRRHEPIPSTRPRSRRGCRVSTRRPSPSAAPEERDGGARRRRGPERSTIRALVDTAPALAEEGGRAG